MKVIFALVLLFVTLAATEATKCHPECRWACDDPICPAVCHPICERPRCQMQCQETQCAKCTVHCERPVCSVRCPKDMCEKESCPKCETVCSPAQCHTTCQAPEPVCSPVCEETRCDWKCRKPENCPKPKCQLQCQKPACESPTTGAAGSCCSCANQNNAMAAMNRANLLEVEGEKMNFLEVMSTMLHREQQGSETMCCPCAQ